MKSHLLTYLNRNHTVNCQIALRVETSLGFMNLYSTLFNMAAVFISIEYVAPTFNMATEYHESLMNIAAMLNTEYMERIFIQAPCWIFFLGFIRRHVESVESVESKAVFIPNEYDAMLN